MKAGSRASPQTGHRHPVGMVPNDVSALVKVATARFGSLEILMHFAGIGIERRALQTTREEWDRVTFPVDGGFVSSGVMKCS